MRAHVRQHCVARRFWRQHLAGMPQFRSSVSPVASLLALSLPPSLPLSQSLSAESRLSPQAPSRQVLSLGISPGAKRQGHDHHNGELRLHWDPASHLCETRTVAPTNSLLLSSLATLLPSIRISASFKAKTRLHFGLCDSNNSKAKKDTEENGACFLSASLPTKSPD